MGDFELDLFLDLGRHVPMRVASTPEAIIHVLRCPVEEIKIDNRTLRGVARYQPAPREAAEVSFLFPSRARDTISGRSLPLLCYKWRPCYKGLEINASLTLRRRCADAGQNGRSILRRDSTIVRVRR